MVEFFALCSLVSCGAPGPRLSLEQQNAITRKCGVASFKYYTPSWNQVGDGAPNLLTIEGKSGKSLRLARQCLHFELRKLAIDHRTVQVGPSVGEALEAELTLCGLHYPSIVSSSEAVYRIVHYSPAKSFSKAERCISDVAEINGVKFVFKELKKGG
jgi:hypothetical protein